MLCSVLNTVLSTQARMFGDTSCFLTENESHHHLTLYSKGKNFTQFIFIRRKISIQWPIYMLKYIIFKSLMGGVVIVYICICVYLIFISGFLGDWFVFKLFFLKQGLV